MSLHATAREANVRDSFKKYFIDGIETTDGVPVSFDKTLNHPDLEDKSIDKWVNIRFGDMNFGTMSDIMVEIYCCTRKDNEGFKLAQLRDTVFNYLSDDTSTDGYVRVPFYASSPTVAWTSLGAILIIEVIESAELEVDDGTKYKILTLICKTPSIA